MSYKFKGKPKGLPFFYSDFFLGESYGEGPLGLLNTTRQ